MSVKASLNGPNRRKKKNNIIDISENVKDDQIEFSKALVLSKDRNFFNLTFDNNYINNVSGTFVKTNNCRNYWNKMYAKRLESEEVCTMWNTALEKHPLNTKVKNPEPNQDACYVFYILLQKTTSPHHHQATRLRSSVML